MIQRQLRVAPKLPKVERHSLFVRQGTKNLLCGSYYREGAAVVCDFNRDRLGMAVRSLYSQGMMRLIPSTKIPGALVLVGGR